MSYFFIGNSIFRRGGGSLSTYWATLISATVENAAPTNVVLTFPTAKPTLGASDFTIAGKTITGAVWAGVVLTLTLSTPIVYAETPVVTFVKTGQTANITNNTLPLLDNYAATIAYSTRLLRTAYAGNCIKVRRSSDDTTQDIGFVDGLLDYDSLLTFCGIGNGFIHTWYDQSGNGENLNNTDTTLQPQIVENGAILNANNRAYASFDGNNDGLFKLKCTRFKNIGGISAFTVTQFKANPTANSIILVISNNTAGIARFAFGAGATSNKYFGGGRRLDANSYQAFDSVSDVGTAQKQVTSINDYTNSDQYIYINGTLDRVENSFQTNGVCSNTDSDNISIGANMYLPLGAGNYSNINIWEIIAYASDQSANRMNIELNQKAFFFDITEGITMEYPISELASMPEAKIQHGFECIGTTIYAAGGVLTKKLYTYDILTDTWTEKADLPFAEADRQSAALRAVNGKLYFIGGYVTGGTNYMDEVFEYDPTTDAWTEKTSIPTAREDFGSAVYDNKIYCFGGLNYSGTYVPLKSLEIYDPATDT